jgi:hypothetical protein
MFPETSLLTRVTRRNVQDGIILLSSSLFDKILPQQENIYRVHISLLRDLVHSHLNPFYTFFNKFACSPIFILFNIWA